MSGKKWILFFVIPYILIGTILYLFASPETISTIFRLINLSALIALITYLYKTKIKKTLYSSMKKKQNDYDDLKKHHKELIHEEKILSQKLENQYQLCSSLLKKVDSWKSCFDIQQEKILKEKKILVEKTKLKLEKQKLLVTNKKLYNEVKSKSLKEVTEQLKKQFSSSQKQEKYMSDLFGLIGKNEQ